MPAAPAFQKKPARGGPFRLSPDPVLDPPWSGASPAEEDESDELPELYGTQALYLVACDPEKLFAYWDFDWSSFHVDEEPALRVFRADGGVAHTAAIHRADVGHYANVPPDGGTYYAEIGARRGEAWRSVARSGLVTVPPGKVSEDRIARYVTIPPGLTFRALGEMMAPHAQSADEPPIETLARIQDQYVVQGPALFDGMPAEQRSSLESLFSSAPPAGGGGGGGANSTSLPTPAQEARPSTWRETLLEQLLNSEANAPGGPRFGRSPTSPG